MKRDNTFLILAAISSALAALLHVGCIIFGAEWYRFLGAGEQMAQMAERGDIYPAVVTSIIAIMLGIWSLYALSGAGVIRRLPLMRVGLIAIALVYLARGLAFVFIMPSFPENGLAFWLVSSGICLLFGIFYSVGIVQRWAYFSGNTPSKE